MSLLRRLSSRSKQKRMTRLESVVITDETPNCPPEMILEVRRRLEEEAKNNPDTFELEDYERMKTSDWLVTRYILRNKGDLKATVDMMVRTGKWRKELGMCQWKDTDFPEQFYKVAGVFPYTKDLQGNTCIYLRIQFHLKVAQLQEPTRMFMLHVINRVDREIDGRGLAVIFDCTGAGLKNVDFDMLWFLIDCLMSYNPKWLNYVLVYDLPWILKGAWKISQSMVPEAQRKLIKFAGKKDITQWIAKENLPDYLGGTCQINYRRAPKGCITLEEVAEKYNISKSDVDKIVKQYEPHIKEADALEEKRRQEKLVRPLVRRQSSVMQLWHFLRRTNSKVEQANAPVSPSTLSPSAPTPDGKGPFSLMRSTTREEEEPAS